MVRSPNLNSYAERFVRTIKDSCLERMILFGEDALRIAVREFVSHYHSERHHQGIGNVPYFSRGRSWRSHETGQNAAAASAECSIIMTGPHDVTRIPVFG